MISFFRTILTAIVVFTATFVLGSIVIIGALLGVRDRPGGMFHRIPALWSRVIMWAAGVKVTVHGLDALHAYEGTAPGSPIRGSYIFASNHISHFDITTLVVALPRHYFVAKQELFSIPLFGKAIRAIGTIPIARDNQKAAFGSYNVAAERIRAGSSVVVFPEGTRGTSYTIRPVKKGPFVLAIQAGAPVVPCIIHGTMEVLPKKSLRIHPAHVHVHLLTPIPVQGLSYDDRDAVARAVHDQMDTAMRTLYPNA